MAWENRNYVYDKLLEHLGERAHIRHDQFKQCELKNGIFITVYPRNNGANLGLTYKEWEGQTQTYSLDKTDKLFSELEKEITRLLKTEQVELQKKWGWWRKKYGIK